MLTLLGDILNWLTAGIAFPLMLLPLAALATHRRVAGSILWLVLVAGLTAAGLVFVALAPRFVGNVRSFDLALFAGCATALAILAAVAGGPRSVAEKLAPKLEAVARGVGRTVMWLVFVMAFVQFAVVILRYVFGVSFLAMQESITYMHGAVFLLAAGYALLTNDQVRVDVFYRDASPKRKALIDFLGAYLFLFPVCLLILWTASPYVGQSWAVREGSAEASGVPALFLLKSCIPAFAVLLSMAGFSIAVKAGETLRGRP
ncbi:MAG: TRAP transporter small permease subunit [Pseudomonadota bacterium]|nr:TRAP transporter small permease subunit [Pseudomonadota bacterium]